jgi:hypothetical protein
MTDDLILKREQAKLAIIDLIEQRPIPVTVEVFRSPTSFSFMMHLHTTPDGYLQLVKAMSSIGLDPFMENYRHKGTDWYYAVVVETYGWKPETQAS